MNNETLEYIRIMSYVFAVAGLLYLGVVIRKATPALHAIASYFFMWGCLLVVQVTNPDNYRQIANVISTPAFILIVIFIYWNIWKVRRD